MLSEYKKYMDTLAEKVKENGAEHSVRVTQDKNGSYILEVFSNKAFQGLAESLFMTAMPEGMTVCLEENLCASEGTLKRFYSQDLNHSTQAVIQQTHEIVKGYMPDLTGLDFLPSNDPFPSIEAVNEEDTLDKFKGYMESLAEKVKENGAEHSVHVTQAKDGDYILEVFSDKAFGGFWTSLFMTAEKGGMTVCLEEDRFSNPATLKRVMLQDFNNNAQAVIQETEKIVKSYMPGLNL